MKYYIKEYQIGENTAGPKAREDVEKILESEGFQPIDIDITINTKFNRKESFPDKLIRRKDIWKKWNSVLQRLTKNDVLFIQLPFLGRIFFQNHFLENFKRKGIKIIALIHDLDSLRFTVNSSFDKINRYRIYQRDIRTLNLANQIIVHNKKMKVKLEKIGVESSKMVELEIFDYLIPDYDNRNNHKEFSLSGPVVIAGALRRKKAEYAYKLPKDCNFNIYGPGYENSSQKNINYLGSFPPDEVPFVLEGCFGLIWDGTSIETCDGPTGEYLQINNPHKTSLYLACGLPIVVWDKAAIAEFVMKNNCGIAIKTLRDLKKALNKISPEKYEELKAAASEIGSRLRSGYYTKSAINVCESKL